MKSKTEANRSTPTSTDKPSGALKNSDDSNTKYSSFRPSAARLRAIALASETALLESNDEFLTEISTQKLNLEIKSMTPNVQLSELDKHKRKLLDKSSSEYIFKHLSEDVWLGRVIHFLQNIKPTVFFGCMKQMSAELLYTFDLKHLVDSSIKENDSEILDYITTLPGYRKGEEIPLVAQTQHLLVLMVFASTIYCKKHDLILDDGILSSISYRALTDVFNIIDKDFPDTICFEDWFRGMLSS
jgi:hypothetical protein